MRVLLTGAAGFLGKAVLKRAEADFEVTTLDALPLPGRHILCDITRGDLLADRLSGLFFDAVIHLAGLTRGTPEDLFRVNTLGTRNLARAVETPRFVSASSCAVYGVPSDPDGTVSEDHRPNPVSAYGQSMLSREQTVPCGVSLRLFNITGPGQPPGMLVPDLAKKLAEIALGIRKEPPVTGPLNTERDYLHVFHAADAFLAAATATDLPRVINVGSGTCHSGFRVLGALAESMGTPPEVVIEAGPSGVPRILADLRRASESLGLVPSISFEKTMSEVADYWLSRLSDSLASRRLTSNSR